MLNEKSAPGVDGQTWRQYCKNSKESIPELHRAFKSGEYKAPHIRRAYIPKGEGEQRPLGLPTVEDKVLQTALTRVLTPVYEEVFLNCSYGYRKEISSGPVYFAVQISSGPVTSPFQGEVG